MIGLVSAIVAGAVLGIGAPIALVSSQSATPPAVDAPYVVYGTTE